MVQWNRSKRCDKDTVPLSGCSPLERGNGCSCNDASVDKPEQRSLNSLLCAQYRKQSKHVVDLCVCGWAAVHEPHPGEF